MCASVTVPESSIRRKAHAVSYYVFLVTYYQNLNLLFVLNPSKFASQLSLGSVFPFVILESDDLVSEF